MAEQLKFCYNEIFVDQLATAIKKEHPNFKVNSFKVSIFDSNWDNLELKERMHHITKQINISLPLNYKKQIGIIDKIVDKFGGMTAMVFPNFIEKYGIDDFKTSIEAIEFYTQFSTSEFAIRPFIIKYPKETMDKMLDWSTHSNHHVRRLSSEGCRPLLPWAMKLQGMVNDPSPIIPILENLKNDNEDYVYRSVANNLNDISKNQPELVIQLCKKWNKDAPKTRQWLIKHALRTLLKKGNLDAMKIFGFGNIEGIKINQLSINKTLIKIGESTYFNLNLTNLTKRAKYRLEFTIMYFKKNGKHNPKVFQLKETQIDINESIDIKKKVTFTDFSTRKHYKGPHFLILKVNGIEMQKIGFELI
jgi:3-methyladenine DNA glycosylase AlkC